MKQPIVLVVAVLLIAMSMGSGCTSPDRAVASTSTSESTNRDDGAMAPAPAARTRSIMGEVIFPHDEHVDDLELTCEECHHEVDAAELATPHPEYFQDFWINCQICHRASGLQKVGPGACSDCHESHLGDVSDQTLSAKVVVHQLCWSCHEAGTGVEASESCQQCHTGAGERS